MIISVEGVVARIDFVKVNEMSEEDVSPQVVRENWASRVVNDFRFPGFDIEVVVLFEFECELRSWVHWCMS